MESVLLMILLIVANVLGTVMIVPQLLRMHRHRLVDGVSGVWVGVGVALNLWWMIYGLEAGLFALVPVSAVAGLLYLLMAERLLAIDHHSTIKSLTMGVLVSGAVPLLALLCGGWHAAGLTIGFSYGLQFTPAVITAVRSVDPVGVSPTTWVMAWVEAVIWLIYGLAFEDGALVIGGSGGAVMASIILTRLLFGPRPDSAVTRLVTA